MSVSARQIGVILKLIGSVGLSFFAGRYFDEAGSQHSFQKTIKNAVSEEAITVEEFTLGEHIFQKHGYLDRVFDLVGFTPQSITSVALKSVISPLITSVTESSASLTGIGYCTAFNNTNECWEENVNFDPSQFLGKGSGAYTGSFLGGTAKLMLSPYIGEGIIAISIIATIGGMIGFVVSRAVEHSVENFLKGEEITPVNHLFNEVEKIANKTAEIFTKVEGTITHIIDALWNNSKEDGTSSLSHNQVINDKYAFVQQEYSKSETTRDSWSMPVIDNSFYHGHFSGTMLAGGEKPHDALPLNFI